MADKLMKATAEGVRVYAAVTTDLVNEAIRRHQCTPVASAALGRTMTGALLMAANLKNKEALTVSFAGDGPLGSIVADASPEGVVRGYVEHPQVDFMLRDDGKLAVGRGVGKGMLSVTRFLGLKEPVTGSIEIVSGEIAEDITRYLYVSEQTPSSVGLGVLVGKDLQAVAAGGFFVQPLPDVTEETLVKLEKNLGKIKPVSAMVKDGLDEKGIIDAVLQDFADIHYMTSTKLQFRCQCSRERIEGVLQSLNASDLDSLIADGKAEVCCHFCNEKYLFSKDELVSILSTDISDEEKRQRLILATADNKDNHSAYLIPCDGLSGVCCFASHDTGEGGYCCCLRLVVCLTLADVVNPIDVLKHIRVVLLEVLLCLVVVEFPDYFALEVGNLVGLALPHTLCALNILTDVVAASVYLAAHAVEMNSVFELEVNAEVVVLVACLTTLAASECSSLDGVLAQHPEEHVDVVHVLLNNMVAREPLPVHPVAYVPFHIAPSWLTVAVPKHALIPVNTSACDFTDETFLNLLEGSNVWTLVMTLCTCHHAEALGNSLL